MAKSRDLYKKIHGSKGTFHAKMGTIQDRNIMDLTEAEDTVVCVSYKAVGSVVYALPKYLKFF